MFNLSLLYSLLIYKRFTSNDIPPCIIKYIKVISKKETTIAKLCVILQKTTAFDRKMENPNY